MKIKRIWMSAQSARKSRYGLYMAGGVAGITALVVLLVAGGMALVLRLGLPQETALLALCLGVTVLAVWLAVALGRRGVRDAFVFFLTEGDRLFVLDARMLARPGRGLTGFAAGALQTQALLRQIADDGRLPAAAGEILRVERIRENRTHRAVVCRVRRPGGAVVRRTCFLFDGIPDADLLLRELERRESWENSLEPPQDKDLLRLLLSALACAGFAAVCALSHPAVGRLPSGVYFPCLGAAFAAFCAAVYFAVRRHRGE